MLQSTMAAVAVALVLGVLGFALWYSKQYPRQVVAAGSIRLEIAGQTRILKTRRVAINGLIFSEVEMPSGTWIGCNGDCAKAVRDAGDCFWEKNGRDQR